FVIKLKRDANPEVVLNNLWKHTPLQSSFAMNVVALVDGVPRTLNLRDALVAYVAHQIEVVTRRSEFRLAAARSRLHIVEGLLRALDVIDEIIATIRASENTAAARASLMAEPYEFSEEQANHILEMALSRLTRLGRTQLETEAAEKRTLIADLEALLADEHRLRMAIRDELKEISDKFGTERRSVLEIDPGELDIEDLIDDDDLVFTMSASGYVKTVPTDEFRLQGRGGRGVAGAKLKEADSVMHLIHTTAHSYLLFFSNRGRVYRLKAHEVPVASRTARGTSIVNLLSLQDGERIQAVIDTRDYEMNRYLLFATAKGRVKRTKFTAYDSSRKAGLIAIRLRDDDELVAVVPTDGVHDILLSSRLGQTIRFAQDEVREMGRTAAGVIGLRLKHKGDSVVSCAVARPGAALLYVTTGGYGKRTPVAAFNCKGRGGQGNIGSKPTEEKGEVVGTLVVDSGDEILAVTANGVVIRVPVGDVSERSRMASGVRVMNPDPGDEVVAVALVGDDIDGNSNRDPSEHIEAEPDAQ
ncbi:MAG: DNA gyrase subunit A, partial [Acidimicrobiaceae bacterium]|nr:DNA gyrase subunit A [Acidimicrobiaceae bacterium]